MVTVEPLKEIKPVVIPLRFFIFGVPVALLHALMVCCALTAFCFLFVLAFGFVEGNDFMKEGWWLVGIIPISPVFLYLIYHEIFTEPLKTTYLIYEDRLEYTEGGEGVRQGMILFKQVVDVQVSISLFQRGCDAGTITLKSAQPFAEGEGVINDTIYKMVNVPQPQEVFELLHKWTVKGAAPEST